ncbi:MAG: hypothetical protein KHW52_06205 [Clostridium sp.]|nr:hypothetical protein [Clostridium sp.]
MKFKVGDKVRVIKCSIDGERCKNLNKVSTITEIGEYLYYPYMLKDIREPFKENELALVEKQFTKSDLKDGDIVTYRNGDKRTVIAGNLINSNGFISKKLNQYTNELKDTVIGESLDIIKVERPVKYETVFERKEEVLDETEKKYLTEVIRPFRKRIQFIQKRKEMTEINPYLRIVFENNDKLVFPYITDNSMYKGMEVNKKYTLKELGL